jgi:glycosyltransferase involved in cell wall biosynthesis
MSRTEAAPRVSVIIPTYNRCDLLEKTLFHLTRQRMPVSEFEVIVSDDGSSDATESVSKSFADKLRIKYTFQEDLGFRAGTARNAGARLASAPVLVFLDTGSLVGPDFLPTHLAEHDTTCHRAVLGYAYGWNPSATEPVRGLDEALCCLPPEDVIARFKDNPVFQDNRHQFLPESADLGCFVVPWPMFLSLNFSIRAEHFWAAGGFDEEFNGWGFEDIELGYRLFQQGMDFRVTRDAWVLEWPHERNHDANLREAAVNIARFLRKHPEPSVEILWYALQETSIWLCDSHYRELTAWRDQVRDLNVTAELSAAAGQIPRGNRIVVIGSGGVVPLSLKGATLIDFDEVSLGKALAVGAFSGHHAIGLRTPLADQSADTVLITSRMTGLWDRWGAYLLAEGRRIGRDVRILGQRKP